MQVQDATIAKKNAEEVKKLERVVDYLPAVEVQMRKTPYPLKNRARHHIVPFLTGSFLTIGDGEIAGAQQQLVTEQTNISIIAALLLSAVLPLAIGHVSDLFSSPDPDIEPDIEAAGITSLFKISWEGTSASFFQDMTYIFFWTSVFFLLIAVVVSMTILLIANELGSDARAHALNKRLGYRMRVPWIAFVVGGFSAAAGLFLRMLVVPPDAPVAITLCVCMLLFTLCLGLLNLYFLMQTNYVAHLTSLFEDVRLDYEQLERDLSAYNDQNASPSLQGFLEAIQCKIREVIVPLSEETMVKAKTCYLVRVNSKVSGSLTREDIVNHVLLGLTH